MKGKILITDSLFIFPEHERMLTDAGYEVIRLDRSAATEDKLAKAVKGKVGYILGGIEHVTEKIIDSADELKAIVFTGDTLEKGKSEEAASRSLSAFSADSAAISY